MRMTRARWRCAAAIGLTGVVAAAGCYHTPLTPDPGPAPLRMPAPDKEGEGCGCYEDSLTGGQIFSMYCSYCHNAPTLAERPFASYKNVAAHMRVRANLTGKEYEKLLVFLRRWHDVPEPEQHEAPSPKRFFFSQPIPELRQQADQPARDPVAGPRPATNDEGTPGQPPPGNSPMQAR